MYEWRVEAKRRFLEQLKDRLNSPAQYKGKTWQWNTIILNKVQELSRFLLGKPKFIDFIEPAPSLKRTDDPDIRRHILESGQKHAEDLGINRSTLHHLRKNARSDKSFRVYQKIACKLR